MSFQDCFPLRLTGLIPLLSKGLRSLLQHHSLKASILWLSAFFMVQLLQLYVTTGKAIALTTETFIGRVIALPFNTLSRFVIAFLSRSKHLLISWLQSPSTVISETEKKKSVTTFTFFPSFCHEVMGPQEKAMAPHSSTPAWKIPWMEEPGRLQSMGSLRVRHD